MQNNNFESTLINNLKNKLKDDKNNIKTLNVLYNFLTYKNDVTWDCRNINLAGMGEIVKSNNLVINEILQTLNYLEENYNVLILKNNTTNEYSCLLIPPSKGSTKRNEGVFATGHPVFENISEGVTDPSNWLIENSFNDQVEIYPVALENHIAFSSFLNHNALALNDIVIKQIKSGNVKSFSDIYNEIKKEENIQK